ncbi:DUF4232 domain-containing protein [Sphingomonas sp. BAUL-RG-20F-R05-02]|uniref:DUF4232 domain-containing protein n=1 Tax=Sphingomonas sp. BAUL-RG-20F-R05-02 TaxID=2914830 RepID=UPI001F595A3B|nr:DUF4232 domain-containing protein [Sphingomonas sp. BAUL-RG-20F-R05-02]
MPLLSLMIAAQALSASAALPPCRLSYLRVSVGGRDGDFNGMSHSGTALMIRNLGADCMLPALPVISLRDAHGRALPAMRRAPVGMHPGPVMLPVRLAAGHQAETDLRWVAGPVFAHNRAVKPTRLTVQIGAGTLHTPITATLYGEAGKPVAFEQTPLHVVEGMPAR